MAETELDRLLKPWTPGTPNLMGFDRAPKDTRVVVAMSGGVDSSVTAALLHELGYEVIGITLQLYDHGEAIQKKGACCAGQDIRDARRVSEMLGIPHYVLDYESRFKDAVMEDFADSYIRGETPIPCVKCNQTVKFRDLLTSSKDLGADCMATGHYIRSIMGEDEKSPRQLLAGVDARKDQSYFLFATTQDQVDYLRFPLGGLHKDTVRDLASRYGLIVANKPDSQDICFVPNGNYAGVVERLRPGASRPGDIIDMEGNVLGQHKGIIHYTIGQRRGLNIGGTENPLYVIKVVADKHQVIVGPKEALKTSEMQVKDVNWIGPEVGEEGRRANVKIRSTQGGVDGTFYASGNQKGRVVFHDPEFGVSPGQAAVFYDGERVLGGGWIESTTSAA